MNHMNHEERQAMNQAREEWMTNSAGKDISEFFWEKGGEFKAQADNAAIAAIAFALKCGHGNEGLEFLRCWNEGDFKAIRKEWPEAPEAVFIGADPLYGNSQKAA